MVVAAYVLLLHVNIYSGLLRAQDRIEIGIVMVGM